MYDRAETASANDRLWQNIRENLGYGPENLTRCDDPWPIWRAPNLVLAQTCGLTVPRRAPPACDPDWHPRLRPARLPARPCTTRFLWFDWTTRATTLLDFAKTRFAYNEALSQSGWAAPQTHAEKMGFRFENTVKSGAHRTSARMVAEGRADIAALDALSWEMIREWDEFAARLRVLTHTIPTPALPFITAQMTDPTPIFTALQTAIATLTSQDRVTLRLRGLIKIPTEEYLKIPTPPGP